MRILERLVLLAATLACSASGQIVIQDSFNATTAGTGFALGSGVNAGITSSSTRLSGTASNNLRYIMTSTAKAASAYSISTNMLRVTPATGAGRFTFSADGTTPFDFASSLGVGSATPSNPVVYDLKISIANNTPGTQRCSFAIGSFEGDATTWDFGVQVYRELAGDDYYTIGKRVDTSAAGIATDVNFYVTNTLPGTIGSKVDLLIRVTDAGAQTNAFGSRVRMSMDDGFTWFYDTASDDDLPNGFRFDAAPRYIMWDVAPDAGPVTYDDFSLRPIPVSGRLVAPVNSAINIGASPALQVVASNAMSGPVSVTYYGRQAPKAYPGRDFCIAVLPDTQNYAREASGSGDATKEMWFAQTDWISTNRISENIAYVATLGDCVQNATSLTEWRNATNAMYRLERRTTTKLMEGLPYGITVGNHDQSPAGDPDGATTHYNNYFGVDHFENKSYYGGHYSDNNDSWFDLFSAGDLDFIVFSFEYGRYGDAILDWAEAVLATNQNRRVIVLTHHAGDDNSDVNATTTSHSAQGAAIYARLKTNPNFFLMLGGHVFNEGGEGRRSDTFSGRTVRTLVSDYQGRFNGGNGLMRLMYFSPSNNLVSVKTYSPFTGVFETDANSQFTFPYNMQPNGAGSPGTPWVALGTNNSVQPGSTNSFRWSGLQANKVYDWYAEITDQSGNRFMTPFNRFTTGINAAPIASNQVIAVTGDKPTDLLLKGSDANGDALVFQIVGQPTRGLVSNFNTNAGTVRYQPAHGFRGLDRLTFSVTDGAATSAPVAVDLNVLAPADANNNSLPDEWEAAYGITNPSGDQDGDGFSNLLEYQSNTNPTNAASYFKVLQSVRGTNGSFQVTWSATGGTRYRVQYSLGDSQGGIVLPMTDLVRPLSLEMDSNPDGTDSIQSFTDDGLTIGAHTNRARYYRVKIVP